MGTQPFDGQVALITGAGRGIGRAIALGLAASGAECFLVARTRGELEAVAREAAGAIVPKVAPADLANDEEVDELASRVAREVGRLDVLVHSAGVIALGRLSDAPVAELDTQYAVNVRAPYRVTQSLLPLLCRSRAQIVFVNSSVIGHPRADVVQFAMTQHALVGLADCLRAEVNPAGVRVLTVFPGRTATSRQEGLFRTENRTYRPELLLQPADVAAAVLHALALPRTAEVTNIHMRPMSKHE